MNKRSLIIPIVGIVLVIAAGGAVMSQLSMSTQGDHPPPGKGDPQNPAEPKPPPQ